MSAFVDMDISKARTTKVTCVERVVFKLHKARLGMNLVSGSAERERDDAFWFAVIRSRGDEAVLQMLIVDQTGQRTAR